MKVSITIWKPTGSVRKNCLLKDRYSRINQPNFQKNSKKSSIMISLQLTITSQPTISAKLLVKSKLYAKINSIVKLYRSYAQVEELIILSLLRLSDSLKYPMSTQLSLQHQSYSSKKQSFLDYLELSIYKISKIVPMEWEACLSKVTTDKIFQINICL